MAGDWFDGAGAGASAELTEVLDSGALDALVQVVATGALISCGLSQDGGALGVTVTLDGRWRREWFRDGAALTTWLGDAIVAIRAAARAVPPAGPSNGQRPRRGRVQAP